MQRSFVFLIALSCIKFCVTKKEIRKAATKYYVTVVAVVVSAVNKEKDSSKDASSVLLEHSAYIKVFSTKRTRILAPFNKHVYIIDLKSNVVLLHSPIYLLAKPKLKVLKKYFNNAIEKG